VQGSLFITYDYLGFKRRKLRFLHQPVWETSKGQLLPTKKRNNTYKGCRKRIACAHDVHEAAPVCEFLCFRPFFDSSSLLETPRNFKWIFFIFYCLQKPSKNHCSSNFISLILHVMSWFVVLHDFSIQNTQNTYGVAWFSIKVNYNNSSENNTICFSNHWQLF